MAKDVIKKLLHKLVPDLNIIKEHKNLQFLGNRLHNPNLWHLNRSSVSIAFAVGLFVAWIPTPGQMAIAAIGAFYFKGNLPISVVLVWLTNPLTMPPLFYFAYLIGLSVLNLPEATFSLSSVLSGDILVPFLTGCLIVGSTCSMLGYFGINLFWRYRTSMKWGSRKQKTSLNKTANKNPFKATDFTFR